MREISLREVQKEPEESKVQEALDKLTEGLVLLAKLNIDTSEALMKAMQSIPEPKVNVQVPESKKVDYVFNIERDSAGRMVKVRAFAQ